MNKETTSAEEKLNEEIKKSGLSKRKWYRRIYLKSDHWKNLREIFFITHAKKCRKCGSKNKIDVHHINYKFIYDVLVSDLEALCRTCHKKEHWKEKAKKKTKRLIKKLQKICQTRMK